MAKPQRKRAHQITHAQRFLPRNRPAPRKLDVATDDTYTMSDTPQLREYIATVSKPAKPKLMTPAELTLQRRKELRPKVTVIK